MNLTYSGAHRRVYRARGPAADQTCPCGAPAGHWAYVGCAPDEAHDERGRPFSGDPSYYTALCVPCHKRADLAARGFKPAPCGTEKGYERHRREGTERCQPCKTARSRADVVRRSARRRARRGESNLVQSR